MARYDDILELEPNLDGAGLRIGIVMSRFNIDASEGLLGACTDELRKHGVHSQDMLLVTVPGALEVPLALDRMARSRRFDALIALGAVIRGETYHFEVVANGILTTDDDDQALGRMSVKGAEVARVAIEMANLLKQLDGQR